MKLTNREIAAIEGFLTRREDGASGSELGAFYGLGKHGQQKMSAAFTVLRALGVNVPDAPKPQSRMLTKDEMAEFREWQRQREASRQPELLRPNGHGGYPTVAS